MIEAPFIYLTANPITPIYLTDGNTASLNSKPWHLLELKKRSVRTDDPDFLIRQLIRQVMNINFTKNCTCSAQFQRYIVFLEENRIRYVVLIRSNTHSISKTFIQFTFF